MKLTKKLHKDQKGLTLIELLAVIVVLGIIAAIAIPAVNSIIKNSEARAQTANAQLFISTARLAVADRSFTGIGFDPTEQGAPIALPQDTDVLPDVPQGPDDTTHERKYRVITLQELLDKGYLDGGLKDPQREDSYNTQQSHVLIVMDEFRGSPGNYQVHWNYLVTLIANDSENTAYYLYTNESEF